MDFLRLSTEQVEILKWSWDFATAHRLHFIGGTPNFGSDFFAFTEGVSFTTIERRFERAGILPILDGDGRPVKAGQHQFYNIFDVQRGHVPSPA